MDIPLPFPFPCGYFCSNIALVAVVGVSVMMGDKDGFQGDDNRRCHVIPTMALLLPTQIMVRGPCFAFALEVFADAAVAGVGVVVGVVVPVLRGDPVMSLGPAGNRSRRAPCTAQGTRTAGGLA